MNAKEWIESEEISYGQEKSKQSTKKKKIRK